MYFLFAASQRVGALLAEALAEAPLDAGGYAFYSALRETQPTSPTDLARHLGMPVTTVLDTLSGLQRREHVARLRQTGQRQSCTAYWSMIVSSISAHRRRAMRSQATTCSASDR